MKIKYTFLDDTVSEVEVSDEIGTVIMDSRREELNAQKRERKHCWAIEANIYEGPEYGKEDDYEWLFADEKRAAAIREEFSRLNDTQKMRVMMLFRGMSINEIARQEGKDPTTIHDAVTRIGMYFVHAVDVEL